MNPVFPAIAIPLESKLDFECPLEHLAALDKCLPAVTRVLFVGWRATDAPFLEKLARNLSRGTRFMIVAGDETNALGVIERLKRAGLAGEFTPFNGGFTEFVVQRGIDSLLRDWNQ